MNNPSQIKSAFKAFALSLPLLLLITMAPRVNADGGGTYSVYDSNRDGYLDRAEFAPFAEARIKRSATPEMWVFENIDSDADGKISEQEMVKALLNEMKMKRQEITR